MLQRGYEQIIEALNDILVKNHNVELVGYRSSLLNSTTVFQIAFLEDVLSVTNGLCLLLVILEEIKEDVDSIYFKSLKQSEDITERVLLIEMRSTVTSRTRKKSCIATSITRLEFHSSTINPFIDVLMEEITYGFDLSELPMLTTFLKLDPDLPESTSSEFREHGMQELQVLYNFYGYEAANEYHGRIIRSEKLLHCPYDALELEFGCYKSYINPQKSKV